MTDKAVETLRKALGWVIDRDSPVAGKESRFYVLISDPDAALSAVRNAAKLRQDETVHIARRLSKRSIKLLNMTPGEVRST